MDLFLLRAIVLVLGSLGAGIHDAKTGLISDKITYAMILLGVIFNVIEFNWIGIGLGAIVFALGYIVYYLGKIGGGDVKLFTGIALLLPFYLESLFIVNVLFYSALLAVVFYSVYYMIKYARIGIDWRENKDNLGKAGLLGILLVVYFVFLLQNSFLPIEASVLLFAALGFGLVFWGFEKGIRKNFFLKKVPIQKLEEDEIVAMEFLDEKTKKIMGSLKGVIGEKEKQGFEKAGVKEILVYRNMPPYGPFIFIAIVLLLLRPELSGLFLI
ncbi:MAG: prepilin peptidase [Candidatus Diapherotrites archaeon]|nr:prepilin peptidase [Candidatus Diapherotrites archaeon]